MQNQTFKILYQDDTFYVDPSLMMNSSKKFKELIADHEENLQPYHIRILRDQFTSRNIGNFLKICQNEQTDVQNSELEEICYIAKMFEAGEIFNTGLKFIQSNIDSNFSVPLNQFESYEYLKLESDTNEENERECIIHHVNLNELEFEDDLEDCTDKEVKKNK